MQIGNFYVSYEHFYETFKPRQWMGTEVMSLYVEKFNIDNQSKNKIDKRLIKKFAFTVSMTVSICYLSASSLCCFIDYCTKHCFFHSKFQKRLIVDPAKFETMFAFCCCNSLYFLLT